MLRLALLIILVLVGFMPPGLCPCWLMHDVRVLHPHPGGYPERPHAHSYLFEIFQSQPAAEVAVSLNPVGRLIEQLLNASLWLARQDSAVFVPGWRALPPPHPHVPLDSLNTSTRHFSFFVSGDSSCLTSSCAR